MQNLKVRGLKIVPYVVWQIICIGPPLGSICDKKTNCVLCFQKGDDFIANTSSELFYHDDRLNVIN